MKTRLVSKVAQRAWYYKSDSTCEHCHDFDLNEKSENVFGVSWKCEKCSQDFIPTAFGPKYDTPSGGLEPWNLFFMDWFPANYYWDNQVEPMLCCVLPNGDHWNIDSRASNCTMKEDRLHRCWVRHGNPSKGEIVHVDKNGHTCQAGTGSILMGGWHGYLHNGDLHE